MDPMETVDEANAVELRDGKANKFNCFILVQRL